MIITDNARYGKKKRDPDRIMIRVPLWEIPLIMIPNAPRGQGGVHSAMPGVHFWGAGCIPNYARLPHKLAVFEYYLFRSSHLYANRLVLAFAYYQPSFTDHVGKIVFSFFLRELRMTYEVIVQP